MSIVQRLINPALCTMQAYHVTSAQDMMKLDAMENPYAWPEDIKIEWLTHLEKVALNRYPDADASALKKKIRKIMHVPPGMEILLGNGSDELIQLIAMAVAQPGRVLMTPEPGFVMYRLISQFVNMQFRPLPLTTNDFLLERNAVLGEIEKQNPTLIFIAYPNNPTGNLFSRDTILEMIESTDALVVIDEAYHAFAHDSFLDELPNYENLLILRTLSKSGLAGLRLGFLVGSPEWITELNKLRLPYNINTLSQKSAEFILDRYDVLANQANKICEDRVSLYNHLENIDAVKVWPSAANFLLFRCLKNNADEIYTGLKEQGILIKNLHGVHPDLAQCLRVTVGTPEQNEYFLITLGNLL